VSVASSSKTRPVVLFTAFEPSGDAHAAPVIRSLRAQLPEVDVYAWGGSKMEDAGAKVVERSAEHAAMGLGAFRRVRAVRGQIRRLKRWARGARIVAHVPVDSPAANFPICRLLRRRGARTVHLIAPQLWAWGGWRTGKLRRRTDLVLCVLPFEEKWFRDRRVPAKFIGHPAINRELDFNALSDAASMLPRGAPRMALFPGSREHEVRKNIGLFVQVFRALQDRHSDLSGIIVAAKPKFTTLIKKRFDVMPTSLQVANIDPDVAVRWCDLALTVSGTMSLDIARQAKPMIGVYRVGKLAKALSFLLLRTKHRLLPNLIAGREIVPEFVPYAGGPLPIVLKATQYLADSKLCARQSTDLQEVLAQYTGKDPGAEAARWIAKVIRGESVA